MNFIRLAPLVAVALAIGACTSQESDSAVGDAVESTGFIADLDELYTLASLERGATGECVGLWDLMRSGEYVIAADSATLGPREIISDRGPGVEVVEREILLEGRQILVAPNDDAIPDALALTEAIQVEGGEPRLDTTEQALQMFDRAGPLLLLATREFDPPVPRLHGIPLFSRGSGAVMNATCPNQVTDQLNFVLETLERQGEEFEVLTEWFEARGVGESSSFDQLEMAWDTAASGPSWIDQDPQRRSLQPGLVPPEIKRELDVRAVMVGLVDSEITSFRTESGVSDSVVGASGVPLPLYFVPSRDTEVQILTGSSGLQEHEFDVIATVEVSDLVDHAGLMVGGSVADPQIELLSAVELGVVMESDAASLQELRRSLLDVEDGE